MSQMHPIVLTTAADIAAAVPALIGYVPTESLVILGFKTMPDDRQVVAVTMCSPLASAPALSPFDDARQVVPVVRSVVATNHLDGVLIALVTGNPEWEPFAAVLAQIVQTTVTDVRDVLHVDAGMVSSYLYPDVDPEPYTGAPAGAKVSEAAYLNGRRVLPDRDTLAKSIDPAHTGEVIATFQLSEATATMQRIGQHCADDLTATATHLYDRLVGLSMHGQTLPEDEAADLVAALMLHTGTRDHLAFLAVRDARTGDASAMLSGLTRLVGRTPNHYLPAVGTVLAMGAYRCGDGALANVSLDRVMHVDPSYSLALLLGSAINAGLPPDVLDMLLLA